MSNLYLPVYFGQKLAARSDVGGFRDAFNDHGLIRVLGAEHAIRVLREVARFP